MELEALYEGLCRREPALFEPESLHKQLDTLAPAISLETLDALLQQLPETAVRHGQNGRQNSDQTQTKQTPIFRGGVVEKGA